PYFLGMMFAPVTKRGAHGHEARVGLLVIGELRFSCAGFAQLVSQITGERGFQCRFVVACADAIAEPKRPADDAFFERIEMRANIAFDRSEMREKGFCGIQRSNFRY